VPGVGAIDRIAIDAGGLTFTGRACGPLGGRAVLLLHGFPQTSWAWRTLLFALGSAGCRAVAPEQRGYCAGARPAEVAAYGTEHLVSDVLDLADAMDLEEFDLVGHDWGAMLGWILASRHPGRVRSLVAVSTPHPLALQEAWEGEGADPDQAALGAAVTSFSRAGLAEQLLLGPDGSGSGLRQVLAESGLDEEHVGVYVEAMREPGTLTAALNWYRAMDRGVLDDLEPVAVPTLSVWSTGDDAFVRTAAEGSGRHVVGPYTLEVLESVSHWIPEMAPVELSALVLGHLGVPATMGP